MYILDKIVVAKRKEVDLKKSIIPISQLEESILFDRPVNSLARRLRASKSGIIAEHKRRSPSKPMINNSLAVQEVVNGYSDAGVCGISVLTDNQFFGGSLDDLLFARASVRTPLLRKEFIIDEYQLLEAKAHGADVVLLIAAILTAQEIRSFARQAANLGLEVLLEVHNEDELKANLIPDIAMIGVNNRNLKTFEVSVETSISLADQIPDDYIKVSESGIDSIATISGLQQYGFNGFLIGENFMKSKNPGREALSFISKLEK